MVICISMGCVLTHGVNVSRLKYKEIHSLFDGGHVLKDDKTGEYVYETKRGQMIPLNANSIGEALKEIKTKQQPSSAQLKAEIHEDMGKKLADLEEKSYNANDVDFILYQDGHGPNGGSWRAKSKNGKGRDIGPFKTISALKSYLKDWVRKVDFE